MCLTNPNCVLSVELQDTRLPGEKGGLGIGDFLATPGDTPTFHKTPDITLGLLDAKDSFEGISTDGNNIAREIACRGVGREIC